MRSKSSIVLPLVPSLPLIQLIVFFHYIFRTQLNVEPREENAVESHPMCRCVARQRPEREVAFLTPHHVGVFPSVVYVPLTFPPLNPPVARVSL